MHSFFKIISATAVAVGISFATANAAPIVFKGNGLNTVPIGNYVKNCGTIGQDYCSSDHDAGLQYMALSLIHI